MCNCENDLEIKRRHSAGHVMSAAVGMIYPEVKRGVGPWTDDGVYQDFDFGGDVLSDKEFKAIEKKMRWIINKDFKIQSSTLSPEKAREVFQNDEYKLELIEEIIARGEELSFYDFVGENGGVFYRDLCAGPHLESTGKIGVFKIMKLAGAYWRGDEKNKMLTRLYAVAFEAPEQLEEYLHLLEEAAKRDHRKLGKELDLFCFSELVGAGLPMFTPKGTFLRNKVADTISEIQGRFGYEKVCIPHIAKKDLYIASGHWDKYKDDLFHVKGKGDTEFVMKPMNCPHHAQIYASKMRSYRDLPIRYGEVTTIYRDEQPGELLGLSRVRSITQDDAHVFCRMDQIKQECRNIIRVAREFYQKLEMWGEDTFWVSLSVRDSENLEKYLGDTDNWDSAEKFLEEVAREEHLDPKRIEGEAAFYGPKLDFMFRDALGREWQLVTVQIDFVQPERFGLEYTNEKGEKERPVMIHRAIAGSLERFLSVIIEHFGGAFPLWLAPVQAHILPISEAHEDFSDALLTEIQAIGGRAEIARSNDSLGKRIRNAQKQKLPMAVIIGDQEVEDGQLTIRRYGEEKDERMSRDAFLALLHG